MDGTTTRAERQKITVPTMPQPDPETIMAWQEEQGGCEAIDGCWVEPDGECQHGAPSWQIYLGWL